MQSIIYRIGNVITSLSAVIIVLILTVIALVFFSHTVFYESLPQTMTEWERQVAAWAIACSWELTILVVVCNVDLLVSKRIPTVLSICSGFVILFFIHAFDPGLTLRDYLQRWFIGLLVASINIVFSSLFYRKWCESNRQKSQSQLITELTIDLAERDSDLKTVRAKINELDLKLLEASDYIIELEAFKKAELIKLTCPHCGLRLETVYKLTAHRSICGRNPKHEAKMIVSGFSEQQA